VDKAQRSDTVTLPVDTMEKQPYEAPELICHGTVEDLVAGINPSGPADLPIATSVI
jgi:hypothetical protein